MNRLITIILILAFGQSYAQTRKWITEGNTQYRNGNFDKAVSAYDKALLSEATNFKAHYNKANSLYRGQGYAAARDEFASLIPEAKSQDAKARLHHNLGNSYLLQGLEAYKKDPNDQEAQKLFRSSIEQYKHALRNDPRSEDSRYNLMYAKRLLKEDQNQDQNKNQDQENQENQDKDQDNKGDKGEENDKGRNGDENKDQNGDQNKDQEDKGDRGDQEKKGDQEKSEEDGEKKDPGKDEKGTNDKGENGEDRKKQNQGLAQMSKEKKDAERSYKAALENQKQNYRKMYQSKEKANSNTTVIDW